MCESLPDERTWEGLLSANLPIFSAGLIEADVRQAWSLYRQAALIESQLRRQVAQDVQLSYQDIMAAQERVAELLLDPSKPKAALERAFAAHRELIRDGE